MNQTSDELIGHYNRAHAARFPGSSQVQAMPWNIAVTTVNEHAARPDQPLYLLFYTAVFYTDFDPEWPIQADWPVVIAGFRRSLGLSQVGFAEAAGVGRATLERWENGRAQPHRGNAMECLTQFRHLVSEPVSAGQLLNIAAAVVLPMMTRPTKEYSGAEIASWLRAGSADHSDLAEVLIGALVESRIIIPIREGEPALENSYFPFAARNLGQRPLAAWESRLLVDAQRLAPGDRKLVTQLARRLADTGSSKGTPVPNKHSVIDSE